MPAASVSEAPVATTQTISKSQAFFEHRCPRCRKGKMFKYSVWNLGKLMASHEHCSHCGLKFEREAGFFWGSMYFSYAFNVVVFLVCFLVLRLVFNDPAIWVYFAVIGGATAVMFPFFARYARTCMLYMFGDVKFRQSYHDGPTCPPENFSR